MISENLGKNQFSYFYFNFTEKKIQKHFFWIKIATENLKKISSRFQSFKYFREKIFRKSFFFNKSYNRKSEKNLLSNFYLNFTGKKNKKKNIFSQSKIISEPLKKCPLFLFSFKILRKKNISEKNFF